MVKKLSVAVVVVWLIAGGIAVWYRTRPVEAPKMVLGESIAKVLPTSRPEKSFAAEVTPTVTDIKHPAKPDQASPEKGPYPMEIDTKKQYEAILKTDVGDITISLTASATPVTVNNFVALARRNFYDNTIFHRVIKGFMIQGGDPNGNGTGSPGYTFADEPFTGEYKRGTVAMANAGPNTNGSQFFIMHADYPLPKSYVIFGNVIQGIESVDTIATAQTKPGGEGSTPVAPVKVTSVEIIEK